MNIELKRVTSDTYGNPRYVVHFMSLLSDKDWDSLPQGLSQMTDGYALAIKKAKKIGGSKYRGKDFGGGIVFQSFNIESTIKDIKGVKNV
jgi:hypothetical protein